MPAITEDVVGVVGVLLRGVHGARVQRQPVHARHVPVGADVQLRLWHAGAWLRTRGGAGGTDHRRLTCGETDLTLRTSNTRDRVHQQKHAVSGVPVVLGDGRRHLRGAEAFEGWRITGRHHEHRTATALWAE